MSSGGIVAGSVLALPAVAWSAIFGWKRTAAHSTKWYMSTLCLCLVYFPLFDYIEVPKK